MIKSILFSETGIYINLALVTCFYTDLSPIKFRPKNALSEIKKQLNDQCGIYKIKLSHK